jgi:hypothetical protein
MRKLVVSTLFSLICVAPVMAQDAPQPAVSPVPEDLATPAPKQNDQQKDTQNQRQMDAQSTKSVEDGLRTRLAHAGFTDIEMMPTSFLVRAKDADGNIVMLVLSPDSVAEFRQVAPQDGQDDSAGAETPPDQQKF